MTIPRGVPTKWEHNEKAIFDSIHLVSNNVKKKKEKLVVTVGSTYGFRAEIITDLKKKLSAADFEIVDINSIRQDKGAKKLNKFLYYEKLASAKFGLALPGVGYDCFRTWELLTMGTIVVAEKVMGLDRSFWRLPVLLVDDFAAVTPEMLRVAYVEALYRAKEFEFERLQQSFWWSLIHRISLSKSNKEYLEKFPFQGARINSEEV